MHNWKALGEIRRFARISTQHNEFIHTKNQFIQRLERYNYDATVVDKCKNLKFTKTPGVHSKKTQPTKKLYHKFTETSLAIDASIEFDQITKLEAQVDYESFMKQSSASESVHKSKISTLDFPGLPDSLFGSPEQSALPRAKATLLMKAMFEKVANEQEARKHAEKQTQDKKVKVVSEMSLMR